jgi:hypothetical protein
MWIPNVRLATPESMPFSATHDKPVVHAKVQEGSRGGVTAILSILFQPSGCLLYAVCGRSYYWAQKRVHWKLAACMGAPLEHKSQL